MPKYLSIPVAVASLPLIVLAAGAACGESGETDAIITSPSQGSTVDAGNVTVAVDVKKFDVVDKIGEEPRDGEGHVHYYIDVGEIPTVDGEPATTDEGTYHAQATTQFTWEDVEAGEHSFAVQLVNNDHTPLSPPVIAQVTVTAEETGGGGAGTPARSPSESPPRSPAATGGSPEPSPTRTQGTFPTGGTRSPAASPSPSPRP